VSSYYGVIFPEFWTGRTGRELREQGGKDAQLLGLYLASTRFANMLGLYHLFVDDVRRDTGLTLGAIARGFHVTASSDFATFDAASSYVWVRHMARFRLGLKASQALGADDNRVIAVNRIYHALEANPFLGDFFDANTKILRLKKRRESVGVVVPLFPHHYRSSLGGAPKPLGSQVQDQGSGTGDQVQVQKKAVASPRNPKNGEDHEPQSRRNLGVITRLVHEVLSAPDAATDFASLKADVKQACAKYHVTYDADVVGTALESALAQRQARV
jgi:hypothetical protein